MTLLLNIAQKQFLEELKRQIYARTLCYETIVEFEDRLKLLGLFLKTIEGSNENDINDIEELLQQMQELYAYKEYNKEPAVVRKKKSWIRRWFNRII